MYSQCILQCEGGHHSACRRDIKSFVETSSCSEGCSTCAAGSAAGAFKDSWGAAPAPESTPPVISATTRLTSSSASASSPSGSIDSIVSPIISSTNPAFSISRAIFPIVRLISLIFTNLFIAVMISALFSMHPWSFIIDIEVCSVDATEFNCAFAVYILSTVLRVLAISLANILTAPILFFFANALHSFTDRCSERLMFRMSLSITLTCF
mmetsp:Transcript_32575/g.72482  ORF Transcript_32575/g.72482 Transcript_32575/m.72482 type:complete len:210 (+) Transcript_32575:559-1188(+)